MSAPLLARVRNKLTGKAPWEVYDSVEQIFEEIDEVSAQNRAEHDPELDRQLRQLRHLAGMRLTREAGERATLIEPDFEALPADTNLPEVRADELSADLIRAAILRHGAILVRGLVDPEQATRLAGEVDRAFEARESIGNGGAYEPYYHDDFWPIPPLKPPGERLQVGAGGGKLAVDSPTVMFEIFDQFDRTPLRGLVEGYLQERPAFAAQKTTLRKAVPEVPGAWHQDGKFLGEVNSLNFWLSLSHCGEAAPGMDLVPRRLEEIVDAGEGADSGFWSIVVTQERAEELAEPAGGILRPIFEPGDAMFFDHLYLHQTASDPSMPNPRFAVESWFFGPSAFPGDYIPLAY